MFKSSFCGRLFGRSPSGRAFRCKSSLCCGLSPAIPNVGERVFTVLHLHLGARAVPSRRPFPTISAGCMAEAGHRGGRTNGTHPSVPSHGASAVCRNFPCPVPPERVPRRLSGSRKLTVLPYTSPARISLPWETGVPGSPEGFFFLHPASNLPLTEMTDRAFFP